MAKKLLALCLLFCMAAEARSPHRRHLGDFDAARYDRWEARLHLLEHQGYSVSWAAVFAEREIFGKVDPFVLNLALSEICERRRP